MARHRAPKRRVRLMLDRAEHEARTYGNWAEPSSPGILGLSSSGTVLLFVGLVFALLILTIWGVVAGSVSFVLIGSVLWLILRKDKHRRNLLSRGATYVAWVWTRRRRRNIYRSGPLSRIPRGTWSPPGLLARLRLTEFRDGFGRPFCLVHARREPGTVTVVVEVQPDGASLVDQQDVDLWVANWGQWITELSEDSSIRGATVTVETRGSVGARLKEEVRVNLSESAPEFARQVVLQAAEQLPRGDGPVTGYVALVMSTAFNGRTRSVDEMGVEIASRLPTITSRLEASGAGAATPLTAQGLCEVVRHAYDPAVGDAIEVGQVRGDVPSLDWQDVGPTAMQVHWDYLVHDSAVSRTWLMTTGPRQLVREGVLRELVGPNSMVRTKRVTLIYRPIPAERAGDTADSDVAATTFNLTSSKRPSSRRVLKRAKAQRTANEEASGASLVNTSMLVTATVKSTDDLVDADAAIEKLGNSARIRLRVVYGSQDSAFAASLPVGIILPHHVAIPVELREL